MRKDLLSKTLVMGIVVLFIGVGVQPAFAVETVSSVDTVKDEDDCGCPSISEQHLVRLRKLSNEIESYNKIISLFSKHNPEIAEEWEELSDKISELAEINKLLEANPPSQESSPICDKLLDIYEDIGNMIEYLEFLLKKYKDNPLLYELLLNFCIIIFWPLMAILALIFYTAQDLGCEWTEWLTIAVHRNKATNNVLLWRLFEQFPLLQRLLDI